MIKFSDLSRANNEVLSDLKEVFSSVAKNSIYINGEVLKSFEDAFSNYLNVKHVVGVANGTDAIEIALKCLGIGPDSEVIVPNHTWISTASAVVKVGAKPVFVDTNEASYVIDHNKIEVAISSKTKAIIAVHLYGNSCEMDEISIIAKKYNLKIIEDTAQAHGSEYKGKKCGSIGDISTFSFYPSKNLGAMGDGGCIATKSDKHAAFIKSYINCGQYEKNKFDLIGRNSRLDTIQAGVLNVKLKFLDRWNKQRIDAAKLYTDFFIDSPEIKTPLFNNHIKHVFHLYVIQTENREKIIANFKKNNIEYGIHYPSFLSNLDVFKDKKIDFSTIDYSNKILSLPMFPGIKETEIKQVVENCIDL